MSKRQDLDITLLTEHDAWNGCEGEHLGLPLLIRYRSQLSRSVDLSNHPYLVIIGWNYSDHPSGMPSLEESVCMNRFEGELVNVLERDALGVLAAVVTTGGVRRWVFYTMNADRFCEPFKCSAGRDKERSLQMDVWLDAEWNHFFQDIVGEAS